MPNPTTLTFQASADHAALTPSGLPVVERYDLEITAVGTTLPQSVTPLGKPTPDTSGVIVVTPEVLLTLTVNQQFVAVVIAVGPGGSGRSQASDPFVRLAAPTAPGKPLLS
jgi:hypothetical protein